MRTLKQKWSFTRKFRSAGVLASAIVSLEQLAKDDSIIPSEAVQIYRAVEHLQRIRLRDAAATEESWARFKAINRR